MRYVAEYGAAFARCKSQRREIEKYTMRVVLYKRRGVSIEATLFVDHEQDLAFFNRITPPPATGAGTASTRSGCARRGQGLWRDNLCGYRFLLVVTGRAARQRHAGVFQE
jgi:hypothetical protein